MTGPREYLFGFLEHSLAFDVGLEKGPQLLGRSSQNYACSWWFWLSRHVPANLMCNPKSAGHTVAKRAVYVQFRQRKPPVADLELPKGETAPFVVGLKKQVQRAVFLFPLKDQCRADLREREHRFVISACAE